MGLLEAGVVLVLFLSVVVGVVVSTRRRRSFQRAMAFLKGHARIQEVRWVGNNEVALLTRLGPGRAELVRTAGTDEVRAELELDVGKRWPPLTLKRAGVGGKLLRDGISTGDASFDRSWIIEARTSAAAMALRPAVRRCIAGMELEKLELNGRHLLLHARDGGLSRPLVVKALALAELLSTGAWDGLAETLGLMEEAEGVLSGELDGVLLRVEQLAEQRVEIHASLSTGLYAIHAQRSAELGAPPVPSNNPVLGSLVALAGEPGQLARLDAGEAHLTEALLQVVHGHPGSRVDPQGVRLQAAESSPDRLVLLVEQVLELARALVAAPGEP